VAADSSAPPAPVAQWIEQPPPKRKVASSTLAWGTTLPPRGHSFSARGHSFSPRGHSFSVRGHSNTRHRCMTLTPTATKSITARSLFPASVTTPLTELNGKTVNCDAAPIFSALPNT
jgi:hypothetical protein